jgi:2-haloacid dehalogenase
MTADPAADSNSRGAGGAVAAVWFDLFGTLVELGPLAEACEAVAPGRGAVLAERWRARQIEATWLRTLMGTWADFETVTRDALIVAVLELGFDDATATAVAATDLVTAFERLPVHPDAVLVAGLLRSAGIRLGILSNGSAGMIERTVARAGLVGWFEFVRTVDAVHRYKPDPAVYALAVQASGVPESRIGFVTANGWDAAGAAAFGLRAAWLRPDPGARIPAVASPPLTIATWSDLPALFGAS